MRPTLESLAAQLGVSRQTVSNAINHPERLTPPTLRRVRAAIAAAGYVPSAAARELRTARSRAIGIRLARFDGIRSHVLDLFLHGLAEQARERGYRLNVFAASDDDDELAMYERLAAAGAIEGVVLQSSHAADRRPARLLEMGIPFLTFGRPWEVGTDPAAAAYDWIDVDGAAGTEAATRQLVAQGHRRIGYLGWPTGPGAGAEREHGWRRAMAALLPGAAAPDLLATSRESAAEAGAAAGTLLHRGVTAVVCASDTLALGALRAAAGRDLAVVGFDDTPAAAELGLSSVAQPVGEAASRAVELLRERLAGRTEPAHVLLTPEPVFR